MVQPPIQGQKSTPITLSFAVESKVWSTAPSTICHIIRLDLKLKITFTRYTPIKEGNNFIHSG